MKMKSLQKLYSHCILSYYCTPRLTTGILRHLHLPSALLSQEAKSGKKLTFDPKQLDVLACPLSKKPLRYDEKNNELVCDEVSVAYPIVDGIPNLNPADGRRLEKNTS